MNDVFPGTDKQANHMMQQSREPGGGGRLPFIENKQVRAAPKGRFLQPFLA